MMHWCAFTVSPPAVGPHVPPAIADKPVLTRDQLYTGALLPSAATASFDKDEMHDAFAAATGAKEVLKN